MRNVHLKASISNLQFLKLGGSLITDKSRPHTPRLEVLARLAVEISTAMQLDPGMHLVLGHGSGSFGHVPAERYATRRGVHTYEEWRGFIEVWQEAAALNHLVIDAFQAAGLPAIAFPASASLLAKNGRVARWELSPLRLALEHGLLPVVYGDVIFDVVRGGTIFSTEDLFAYLARAFSPKRLLLAGLEPGVWADFPACTHLIPCITPANYAEIAPALHGSASTDVTGGMVSKVQETLMLVAQIPGLQARIFSGETPGLVQQALIGTPVGTLIQGE